MSRLASMAIMAAVTLVARHGHAGNGNGGVGRGGYGCDGHGGYGCHGSKESARDGRGGYACDGHGGYGCKAAREALRHERHHGTDVADDGGVAAARSARRTPAAIPPRPTEAPQPRATPQPARPTTTTRTPAPPS